MSIFVPITYDRTEQINKTVPQSVPANMRDAFYDQAAKAQISPTLFATIMRREQGKNASSTNYKMTGTDPNDKGLMQVNKINVPLISTRFKKELGRTYNPANPGDSIIGARMVLEENARQFKTKGVTYTPNELVDSYNTGVNGLLNAKAGDPEAMARRLRYQSQGL